MQDYRKYINSRWCKSYCFNHIYCKICSIVVLSLDYVPEVLNLSWFFLDQWVVPACKYLYICLSLGFLHSAESKLLFTDTFLRPHCQLWSSAQWYSWWNTRWSSQSGEQGSWTSYLSGVPSSHVCSGSLSMVSWLGLALTWPFSCMVLLDPRLGWQPWWDR